MSSTHPLVIPVAPKVPEADPSPWLTDLWRRGGAFAADSAEALSLLAHEASQGKASTGSAAFRPEVTSLAAILDAVRSTVAGLHSDAEIYAVGFHPTMVTAGTSYAGRNVLIGAKPLMDRSLTEGQRAAILAGASLHETGHINHSQPYREAVDARWPESHPDTSIAHFVNNAGEDNRIEALQSSMYPGLVAALQTAAWYFGEANARGIEATGLSVPFPAVAATPNDRRSCVVQAVRYPWQCIWTHSPEAQAAFEYLRGWADRMASPHTVDEHVRLVEECVEWVNAAPSPNPVPEEPQDGGDDGDPNDQPGPKGPSGEGKGKSSDKSDEDSDESGSGQGDPDSDDDGSEGDDSDESESGEGNDADSEESEDGDQGEGQDGDDSQGESGDNGDGDSDPKGQGSESNGMGTKSDGQSQDSDSDGDIDSQGQTQQSSATDGGQGTFHMPELDGDCPVESLQDDTVQRTAQSAADAFEGGRKAIRRMRRYGNHVVVEKTLEGWVGAMDHMSTLSEGLTEQDSTAVKLTDHAHVQRVLPKAAWKTRGHAIEDSATRHKAIAAVINSSRKGVGAPERMVRSGRIDRTRLHRVAQLDNRVFIRKEAAAPQRIRVYFLLDASGSMTDTPERVPNVLQAATDLAGAVESIPWATGKVYAYTSFETGSIFDLIGNGTTTEDAMGQVHHTQVVPLWTKGEPRDGIVEYYNIQKGGTPEGYGLAYVCDDMLADLRSGERGVVIVLSDGIPDDADYTRTVVEYYRRQGLRIVNVGIAASLQKQTQQHIYGNDHVAYDPNVNVFARNLGRVVGSSI